MQRRVTAGFIAVAGLLMGSWALCQSGTPSPAELHKRVAAMRAAGRDGENFNLGQVRAIIKAENFKLLPAADRQFLLQAGGEFSLRTSDYHQANTWLADACVLPGAALQCWDLRLTAAYFARLPGDAANALLVLAERWPDRIDTINLEVANRVANHATAQYVGAEARIKLLETLRRAKWQSIPADETDYLWHELALLLLERGQTTRARAAASALVVPGFVIGLWSDKRYDAITDGWSRPLDIRPYVERRIVRARQAVEKHPASLLEVLTLCKVLVSSGEFAEADQVIVAAREKMRVTPAAFDDGAATAGALDECEKVLNYDSGRWQLVEQARRRDAAVLRNGKADPDAVLQLAQFSLDMGRTAEARSILATLEPLGEVDLYTQQVFRYLQMQLALEAGDKARAQSELEWLHDYGQDDSGVYIAALLHANELDQAAAWVIKSLQNPEERSRTLYTLQGFRVYSQSERMKLYRQRHEMMRNRSDVQEAVAAVGRLGNFPIPNQ